MQLFPGLIYRMIKPKVVLLIFVSGKIVLTGAKVISLSDSHVLRESSLLHVECAPPSGSRRDIRRVQHYLYGAHGVPKGIMSLPLLVLLGASLSLLCIFYCPMLCGYFRLVSPSHIPFHHRQSRTTFSYTSTISHVVPSNRLIIHTNKSLPVAHNN